MSHIPPTSPLFVASHIQSMAGKANDANTAKIMTGLSVALLLIMLIREGREMWRGDQQKQSWQQREQERRSQQGRER